MKTELPESTIYDEAYFLSSACDGLNDYLSGSISVVKERELSLLDIEPGHRVLDLGCGRGEVAAEIARQGAFPTGLDYSADAVRLSKRLLGQDGSVIRADGSRLPFSDGTFDRVLLGDVIEHLPWNLAAECLREVERVLAPGGRALVHTSPNVWFINVIKPSVVLCLRLMRRQDTLARFAEYDRLRGAMHPNELSPVTFPRLIREAGIRGQVWVDRDVLRSGSSEWTRDLAGKSYVRLAGRIAGLWPLRLILGNDLYSLIIKDRVARRASVA